MSKKVLVISSSPRKDGNSDTLCNEFVKGALESNHCVEKINLKEKNINYCSGCGYCSKNGYNGCAQKDDMTDILKLIIDADVIVMATPIYFFTMCGQMKTLIDRCCAGYTKIRNKEFYFIMTAAENGKEILNRTLEEFRGFLDCVPGSIEKGAIYGTGVWEKGDIKNTPYLKQAYEMGKNL